MSKNGRFLELCSRVNFIWGGGVNFEVGCVHPQKKTQNTLLEKEKEEERNRKESPAKNPSSHHDINQKLAKIIKRSLKIPRW